MVLTVALSKKCSRSPCERHGLGPTALPTVPEEDPACVPSSTCLLASFLIQKSPRELSAVVEELLPMAFKNADMLPPAPLAAVYRWAGSAYGRCSAV